MSLSREHAEPWLTCGPPAGVIETIQAYIGAGCTTPPRHFASPSLREQVQRGIEEVMPAFAI